MHVKGMGVTDMHGDACKREGGACKGEGDACKGEGGDWKGGGVLWYLSSAPVLTFFVSHSPNRNLHKRESAAWGLVARYPASLLKFLPSLRNITSYTYQ
jgi:hypothetical protein